MEDKKRPFLAPFALSVAALLSRGVAPATAAVSDRQLVISPSAPIVIADSHSSHASHDSHSSHSSHSSGGASAP